MSAHAGGKRPAAADAPVLERLELTPLGGGNEVGRSCLILRYKGKTIMLDCGVLPSFQGLASLPWLGEIDPAEVDVVFITHFHLDHAAALPHFTERLTGFRGRVFATHATIACMKLMLSDYVRVTSMGGGSGGGGGDDAGLYTERDLDRCIGRMEAVDFKQRMAADGVSFEFFNAGHVLGAAMVLLEIAGVRILYTGDYSCEEDRHLMAAELPPKETQPDVLIVEATYGMQVHESKDEREARFCESVARVVLRGGRCLLPVFALGRAQELLLILDEMWAARPELQHVPIYFSSRLATRSLDVYRTYISAMNPRIRAAMAVRNPWDFKFVRPLARPDDFRDDGPCVVLASPGMLQSGFSRALFDRWAEDPRNGVVLAGYSVEGTMARRLESNPAEVEALGGRKLTRRIGVDRVSFSAHADSLQTAAFVDALAPPVIVLVHGERNEMRRLHDSLAQKYRSTAAQVFMPGNGATVAIGYRETRVVKAAGSIASRRLVAGRKVAGILLHRHFGYLLVAPPDVAAQTPLATATLAQRLHVPFRGNFDALLFVAAGMYEGTTDGIESERTAPHPQRRRRTLAVAGGLVTATHAPPDRVVLSWDAGPIADAVADSLVALLAQVEVSQAALRASASPCGHGGHGSHAHDGCDHGGEERMGAHGGADGSDAAAAAGGGGERRTVVGVEVLSDDGVDGVGGGVEGAERSSAGAGAGGTVADVPESVVTPVAGGDAVAHGVVRSVDTDVAAGGDGAAIGIADIAAMAQTDAWAAAIAGMDTGVLPQSSNYGAPEPAEPGDGAAAGADGQLPSLPPRLARRRDALLTVLCEQYGSDAVAYCGPDGRAVAERFEVVTVVAPPPEAPRAAVAPPPAPPYFVLAAAIDGAVGLVRCAAMGASGGGAWWAGQSGVGGGGGFSVDIVAAPPFDGDAGVGVGLGLDGPAAAALAAAVWWPLHPGAALAATVAGTPPPPAPRTVDDPKLLGTLRRTVAAVDALFAPVNFGAGAPAS